MTKARLALAATILAAATLLTSAAEAGKRVQLQFGFPLGTFTAHGNSGGSGSYRSYRKPRHDTVRRTTKSKIDVSKKKAPSKPLAKAASETETKKAKAETENSSVSTAAAKDTGSTLDLAPAGAEPSGPASAECKKFFPSVGMTLTVPCE